MSHAITGMLSCQKMNKNVSSRCSRAVRIHARDKTHEQRKPKRKRKKSTMECDNFITYLNTRLMKVLQPRNENKSCKLVLPITQNTIICYPLPRVDYTKPLLPADETSYPTQVSEQQGSDEFVCSNAESLLYIHGNDSFPRHIAPSGIPTQNERIREVRTAPRENSERNIRKTYMNPPRHPEFIDFDKRLKSFARWFKQKPDPTSLCNAGFFFTNTGDLVRCYQCGIGLKDFSPADNPLNDHVKHSPECFYLQEYLGQDGLAKIKRKVIGDDMQLYESKISKYRHPEYQAYPVRLSSFGKWPPCLMQKPEQLAEAGLYYTGFDDQVRCFACDGGLKKWDPEDDPWTEHCRWFPECPYVLEQKGEEYVRLVQKATATEIQERLNTENIPTYTTREPDISSEMERLRLKDPELNAMIKEHRNTCLEMGYQEKDFEIAARKLATNGNVRPTIEDILDALETGEQGEDLSNNHSPETPKEENARLKRLLYCMTCKVNSVNALFLPCTHHRMCMTCAELLTECPVCERRIRQKIKTFLV